MTALTRRTLVTGGALAGVAVTTGCLRGEDAPSPNGGARCFAGYDHQRRLDGVRVFQQAFPPVVDTVDDVYQYWSCTDAATSPDIDRSSWTQGNIWAFV